MSFFDKDVFFYTTFGGETLSISSAIANIKFLKKNKVLQKINLNGEKLIKNINNLIKKYQISNISIEGYGARFRFVLKDKDNILKTFIQEKYLENNILWNGIITLSYAHKGREINHFLKSTDKIFKIIKEHSFKSLKNKIRGKLIKNRPL